MFIGRETELESLDCCYRSEKQEVVVIYGRRRIGKTSLINKFCADKPDVIRFVGFEGNAKLLLSALCDAVTSKLDISFRNFNPENIRSILESVFKASRNDKKLIFVIDEFPYLVKEFPETMGILQELIDEYKEKGNLKLILSGSSVSFMERQVLADPSPLYGRRTLSIHLKEFSINEAALLFEGINITNFDLMTIYSITGGVPLYLQLFAERSSWKESLKALFFQRNGYLYNEPRTLLLMELREPANYYSICLLLSHGVNRVSELADKSGFTTAAVSAILKRLEVIGIVELKESIHSKVRKPHWVIVDSLFAFYFQFIMPFSALIEMESINGVEEYFNSHINAFVGKCFEKIALMHFIKSNSSFGVVKFGSWWGNNPHLKREEEIDIVIQGVNGSWVFGECKWTESKVGISVLDTLKSRAELVVQNANKLYVLYSKTGFTEELLKLAEVDKSIRCISFSEMLEEHKN